MPGVKDGVADHIRRRLDELSPNDRRIARRLLDHYPEAPFETAESLAAKAGVSKAAVVRFATRIGFAGFTGLHDALRAEALTRLAAPADARVPADGDRGDVLDGFLARAGAGLAEVAAGIDREAFAEASAMLTRGTSKIGIFGHRKSAALAEYAYYLLNPLLGNMWPIAAGEPAIADHLIDLEPGDRLIAFTFRRYARVTAEVVRAFADAGGVSVLLTDDHMAPAAAHATHVLVCRPAPSHGFESMAPAVVVLEALAADVAVRVGRRGGRRMDAAEQLWRQFGTYGDEHPGRP
jgi:DNA-binding MurR/RpiR family transcriptional regulator